jgi:hypothetical protein
MRAQKAKSSVVFGFIGVLRFLKRLAFAKITFFGG